MCTCYAHCASVCRKQRKMLHIFYQSPLFYFSAAGFSTEPRAKLATSKACQFFCPLPMVLGSRQHVEAFYAVAGDLNSDPTQQALGPWIHRIHLTSPLHGQMSLHCGLFLGSGKRAFLLRFLLKRREWVLMFLPVMAQIGTNA